MLASLLNFICCLLSIYMYIFLFQKDFKNFEFPTLPPKRVSVFYPYFPFLKTHPFTLFGGLIGFYSRYNFVTILIPSSHNEVSLIRAKQWDPSTTPRFKATSLLPLVDTNRIQTENFLYVFLCRRSRTHQFPPWSTLQSNVTLLQPHPHSTTHCPVPIAQKHDEALIFQNIRQSWVDAQHQQARIQV